MRATALVPWIADPGLFGYPNRVSCRRSIPARMALYAGVLTCATGSLAALLATSGATFGSLPTLLLLAACAIGVQRARIRVATNIEQSLSLLPVLCAALVLGPVAGLVVGVVSLLPDLRRPWLRWIIYTNGRGLNGALVGILAHRIAPPGSSGFIAIAAASAAAALVAEVFDVAFAALTFRLRGNAVRPLLASLVPLSATAVPIFATIVALVAQAYVSISPWTLPMFLFPVIGVQRLFLLYENQRSHAESLEIANTRLRASSLGFAEALVAALDARDSYTAGHSEAVAVYARDIARQLGMTSAEIDFAYQCGLIHDIGKISLPAGLIEKQGPLTAEERCAMEKHSEAGEALLMRIEEFAEMGSVVRHHHERFDGAGYPDALEGTTIPHISRVIAVADAYNAMTSDRPYRAALSPSVAYRRLLEGRGSQFDPAVVNAFGEILRSANLAYRQGAFRDLAGEGRSRSGFSGQQSALAVA